MPTSIDNFEDIKVKEQSIENMARGRKIYEPPRYMSVNEAVDELMEIEQLRQENGTQLYHLTVTFQCAAAM